MTSTTFSGPATTEKETSAVADQARYNMSACRRVFAQTDGEGQSRPAPWPAYGMPVWHPSPAGRVTIFTDVSDVRKPPAVPEICRSGAAPEQTNNESTAQ